MHNRTTVTNYIIGQSYAGETILWSQLSHPNLLPFYGIYYLDGRSGGIALVSPWMRNGNVIEYLKANPEAPRLPLVRTDTSVMRNHTCCRCRSTILLRV